jgi:Integron Cassette Protein Hfx_Cass5
LINWFKKDIYKGYKGILKNAFPKSIEQDLKIVLKVIPFSDNNIKLTDGNFHKVDNLIFDNSQIIKVGNEDLTIPYRVYFNEPNQLVEKLLTVNQQTILNCIYLRHHNGFVRQKRLEKLKSINEYWITPYLFQLLGEYVIEILEVIDKQHNNTILDNFKQFKLDNPKYFIQTESRMISYWNQYYRRNNTKLNSYIGRLLFNKIKMKVIGLDIDEIIEIAIDEKERLLIKPKNTRFTLIYRTATEVHWDEKLLSLYSPKPREWTYLNWYQHIINVAEVECNTKLILTARTKWTNISNELKKTINRR